MPTNPFKKSTKGKSQELDLGVYLDEFNVGNEGWEDETERTWTCTMCKKYVSMSHIAKLWPLNEDLESKVRRWEGSMKSCNSEHFKQRYEEVWAATGLAASKPNIMNYSTMAMVWAEIVLQKDVDWRTVIGMNKKTKMTANQAVILSNWVGRSDCMPAWSNRGQYDYPPWPMKDAEDDDDEEALPPPPPLSERHERRDERDNIQYEHEMQEALRRSREDYGPPRTHHASSRDAPQHGGGSSRSTRDRQDDSEDFPNIGGGFLDPRNTDLWSSQHGGSQYYPPTGGPSHTDYSGSQYGGSQYYPGTGGQGSYGPYGGTTRAEDNAPIPPPPFGGTYNPYYTDYGVGGQSSGHGPQGGSNSARKSQKHDSSSDSE